MHGFIDVHWLLMNKVVKLLQVSPIEYGHVLLIARVLDCLPQRIDHMSFFLALSLAKEAADRFSRMGYNSLGTFATINHLHFQAYYLASPFPVEKVPTLRVMTSTSMQRYGVVVSQLLKFPVRSLVFEGGDTLWDLSSAVANSCILLQHNNIRFNILIADCGKRVFLFPQCYAEKQARGEVSQELLETQVNPAVWEIGGHIVLKRREDFEKASRIVAQQSGVGLLALAAAFGGAADRRCVLLWRRASTKDETEGASQASSCRSLRADLLGTGVGPAVVGGHEQRARKAGVAGAIAAKEQGCRGFKARRHSSLAATCRVTMAGRCSWVNKRDKARW
ncbi:GDP-L-galactose phosphorylase 1-like [Eucalyptus grandis]|uniref:GDP-L-galactose phosphorylase 1-like n=1 Tax=Eucalyptus grandis TaxID=71139 RepID=UPI00192F06EC|nr:GDP-L-galactose phosphorylase 1-like [Eucalyptus grandis]